MDSCIGDDERIGPMLASHVRKWIVKAAEHEEAAQKARARKEREQAKWINAPAELLRKLTAVHDWEIAHHEEQAQSIPPTCRDSGPGLHTRFTGRTTGRTVPTRAWRLKLPHG